MYSHNYDDASSMDSHNYDEGSSAKYDAGSMYSHNYDDWSKMDSHNYDEGSSAKYDASSMDSHNYDYDDDGGSNDDTDAQADESGDLNNPGLPSIGSGNDDDASKMDSGGSYGAYPDMGNLCAAADDNEFYPDKIVHAECRT